MKPLYPIRFALLLLLLACPGSAPAREFHRIAILPFLRAGVGGGTEPAGETLAVLLVDRLADAGRVRVLESSRVRAMAGGAMDPGDAAKLRGIGLALKADLVAVATWDGDPSAIRVRLHTMVVGLDLYRVDEVRGETGRLERLSGRLARRLLAALAVSLAPEREARLGREGFRSASRLSEYGRAASHPSPGERLELLRALALGEDTSPDALVRLGDACLVADRPREAEAAYQRALIGDPDLLTASQNLGVLRLREGRWDEALAEFRKVLDWAPGFPDAWYNLGLACQSQDADSAAASAYGRVIDLEPDHRAARLNLGVLYARHAQYADAGRLFGEILREDPGDLPARLNMASVLARTGRPEEAATAFEEVLRLRPGDLRARNGLIEAWLTLARRDLKEGRPAEAESRCRRAAGLDSTDGAIRLTWSVALAAKGDTARSLREAERAVLLAPGDPDARMQLGVLRVGLRRFEEAAAAFREAARLDTAGAVAWRNLGIALTDAGRPEEAIPALRKALSLDAADPGLHAALGRACAETKDYASAATAYARAVCLQPADGSLHARLGRARALAGRADSARASFERAVRLSNRPGSTWSEVGAFYDRNGEGAAAIDAYRKAVAVDPGLLEARRRLGVLLSGSGADLSGARELAEVARRNPGDPGVWPELARIYRDRGDYAKAAEACESAARSEPARAAVHLHHAGLLWLRIPDARAARRALNLAADADPGDATIRRSLARACLLDGRPGDAAEHYRRLLDLPSAGSAPGIAAIRLEMAEALRDARREGEAVTACRAALREDPKSADGRALLADLYACQFRYELAIPEYEEALRLDPARDDLYLSLGRACQQAGSRDRAIRAIRTYLDRSRGRVRTGRIAEAEALLRALTGSPE